ncbi:aminopeptidase [Guggenheimella bovis]
MKNYLKNYASILIEMGVQTHPGQILTINIDPRDHEFALMLAEKAYEKGAKEVRVHFSDTRLDRLFYKHASDEILTKIEPYEVERLNSIEFDDHARLSVRRQTFETFRDVDTSRISLRNKMVLPKLGPSRILTSKSLRTWCLGNIVNEEWARAIFPDKSTEEAMELLSKHFYSIVRADLEDPIGAWKAHAKNLKEKRDTLNSLQIKSLHFESNTADLTIDIIDKHYWQGGEKVNEFGHSFIANLPTEEVHTMPEKTGVNGWIRNTKPLYHNGQEIDDFILEFKEGKVVHFEAKKGQKELEMILSEDEGASYLGEVALVPFHSPISDSGIIFMDTLFDENASCHLALGNAYPASMVGGKEMNTEELKKNGANTSITHVDFMVGSSDLSITATLKDGSQKKIFTNGAWAI